MFRKSQLMVQSEFGRRFVPYKTLMLSYATLCHKKLRSLVCSDGNWTGMRFTNCWKGWTGGIFHGKYETQLPRRSRTGWLFNFTLIRSATCCPDSCSHNDKNRIYMSSFALLIWLYNMEVSVSDWHGTYPRPAMIRQCEISTLNFLTDRKQIVPALANIQMPVKRITHR